jgi:hypothetical protein
MEALETESLLLLPLLLLLLLQVFETSEVGGSFKMEDL